MNQGRDMSLEQNHRWVKQAQVILRVGIGIACVIQGFRMLSRGLQQRSASQTRF